MSTPEFQIRPARASDRDAVLAFCRHTWDWGDYLGEVWDAWLADPRGRFAVGTLGAQVVGVDKLTFLSPDEAFFEGLRIDPAYRGHGYAGHFEEYMLAEAARQGARVVRFLTAVDNTAVHKNAARHDFRRGPTLLHWRCPANAPGTTSAPVMQLLTPGPAAAAAWAALPTAPLGIALGGLISMRWHVQAWTPALWTAWLAAGRLWVLPGDPGAAPAGVVALLPGDGADADAWLAWLDARPCDPSTVAALVTTAHAAAHSGDATTLTAMLPSLPALDAGLRAAGWTTDGAAHGFLVFEKDLPAP